MPYRRKKVDAQKWIQFGVGVAVFLGGMFTNALSISRNIASVELVEARYKSAISYTDSRISDAVRELREYSDRNRLIMEKAMAEQTSLIREQGAKLTGLDEWMKRMSIYIQSRERR